MRTNKELADLKGRVALVTGAAGHLGYAMSEALVEAGAQVAVVDVNKDACERSAAALSAIRPDGAFGVAADLGQEKQVRACVNRVLDQTKRLDILIHSAAYVGSSSLAGWAVPFKDQTVDAWRQAMEVNLTAAFILAQEAAPVLELSGRGSIILISSIYGVAGPDWKLYEGTSMANPAAYGASKGGLIQLTRYLATTLAPKIRVNAISPGGVWRQQPESFHARYEQRTPLGRMATDEDFKGPCLFLASDLSAYVTGQNLMVDGGWTSW